MQDLFDVYIDEYGTNSLYTEKSGVTDLFINTAVIVQQKDTQQLEQKIREVSKEKCGGAEIKSSRICGNIKRRIEFLMEFKDCPFSYYAFIVNKTKVDKNSPFQYKETFYKWVNNQLIRRINPLYGVNIFSDEMMSKDFRDSFDSYFTKRGLHDLFPHFYHRFSNSKETPIIQLADLISGSLSYCFESSKRSSESEIIREILKTKEISLSVYPFNKSYYKEDDRAEDSSINSLIRPMCLSMAQKYIDNNSDSNDILKRQQSKVLEILLTASIIEEEGHRSFYKDELIDLLEKDGYEKINSYTFITGIIAPIRDNGIIIAGSQNGYELATTISEIRKYILQDAKIIFPMLSRLEKARKIIREYTGNTCDILDDSELKDIIDKLSEERIKELSSSNIEINEENIEGDNK